MRSRAAFVWRALALLWWTFFPAASPVHAQRLVTPNGNPTPPDPLAQPTLWNASLVDPHHLYVPLLMTLSTMGLPPAYAIMYAMDGAFTIGTYSTWANYEPEVEMGMFTTDWGYYLYNGGASWALEYTNGPRDAVLHGNTLHFLQLVATNVPRWEFGGMPQEGSLWTDPSGVSWGIDGKLIGVHWPIYDSVPSETDDNIMLDSPSAAFDAADGVWFRFFDFRDQLDPWGTVTISEFGVAWGYQFYPAN